MRISDLRSWPTKAGGRHVEADVDGEPLWFASDDAMLTPSSEAFASALLLPAASQGEPLEVYAELDRSWLERVPAILHRAKEWWQLPGTRIIATDVVDHPRPSPGKIAQCFTGGVDSFHTLICANTPPSILVFAQGYDIPLGDRARLDAFLPGFRETAAAFDATAVLVATNLREHHAFRKAGWKISHGGALAALGHILGNEVERIVIPSGFPYYDPRPWGTHWDLDPLWSSERVAVQHADATLRRHLKVKAIADHHLVRRHVRVCWENRAPTGNCSRCEKCVRTMIAFAITGRLHQCEAFDGTVPIEHRVDGLRTIKSHLISNYEELLHMVDNPRLGAAIERLLDRSRRPWRPTMMRTLVDRLRRFKSW
jgi:hypothetical protein